MKVWTAASLRWIDIKLIFGYIKDNGSINTFFIYDIWWRLQYFANRLLTVTVTQHFTNSVPIFCQLFLTFWQHFAINFPTFSQHHTSTQHFNNIFQIFCQHFAYNLPTYSLNFPNLFPTPSFLPIFYILPFCLNFLYITKLSYITSW